MRNNVTELVFIVDCSFFTAGKEEKIADIINQTIKKYRYDGGYVNTFLFGRESHILHDRLKIAAVKPVAFTDIKTGNQGGARYYDTLVSAIRHIYNIHYYIRPEDVPSKTLFCILSSGMDTASTRYNSQSAMTLVEEIKKEKDWQFVFEDMSYPADASPIPPAVHKTLPASPDSSRPSPLPRYNDSPFTDYELDEIIQMLKNRAKE